MEAQSGLSDVETEVHARAKVHRATAEQRNWRLSLAGHELWQWQGRRRQKLRAQGNSGGFARGGGNMK